MKKFETPDVEVVKFAVEDVITASGGEPEFFDNPCITV